MINKNKKKWLRLIFIVLVSKLIVISSLASASDEKVLVINSGSSAPLIINHNTGFYPRLVEALFERLNIKARTTHSPSARSLLNANQGIDDGVIGRIKGLDNKLTNLVRVPEKVLDLEFTAFSNDKQLKINKWADLQQYNVGYIRGWKIYDKNVVSYKSLVKVKNTKQLFILLKNKRVDVILSQHIPGNFMMTQLNYYPHEVKPALLSREMFLYMHKKHSNLVPLITKELKTLKNDGTYQRLYDKYITQMINPIAN